MQGNKLLKITVSAIAIVALLLGAFIAAFPVEATSPWDFPRLNYIDFREAYPAATARTAAQSGLIDNFLGAITTADVDALRNPPYNWNVSGVGGFHWCYHGFNCRDTPGVWAGSMVWMYNRTSTFELYPLNRSAFRLALAYAVGTDKEPWLDSIFGYIVAPQYWFVPQANAFFVNPYMQPFYNNWTKAEEILIADGWQHLAGPDTIKNTKATPSTDDKWIMPNGKVFYDGTGTLPTPGSNGYSQRYAGIYYTADKPVYGIFVACPGDNLAPTSHETSRRHVRQWNWFFMGQNVTGALDQTNTACFIDLPDDTYQFVYYSPRYNRDHDMFMLCFSFGKDPLYLYDLFHPDTDVRGSANTAGHVNPIKDKILWTLRNWQFRDYEILQWNLGDYPTGKVLPACTYLNLPTPPPPISQVYIGRCNVVGVYKEVLVLGTDYTVVGAQIHLEKTVTLYPGECIIVEFTAGSYTRSFVDMDLMQKLVWFVQWHLFYLAPFETIYSRNYYNLWAPFLQGWVNMPGFGSAPTTTLMPWSWANVHKVGTPVGGNMTWQVDGNAVTMNPITMAWVYEVEQVNRLFDTGYVLTPYSHLYSPWVATGWKILPYINLTEGVANGQIIKIWLRNDVYWQDGTPANAWDAKWNYDFIYSIKRGEQVSLWQWYIKSVVVHDHLIDIYVNASGLWKALEYIAGVYGFPQVVWQPFWGNGTAAAAFRPWATRYDTWTGTPAPVWSDRNGDSIGDLTCLYGTGPFVLDFWDEIALSRVYKNPIYWVRVLGPKFAGLQVGLSDNQVGKVDDSALIPVMTKPFYYGHVWYTQYAGVWWSPPTTDPTNDYTWNITCGAYLIASGSGSLTGADVDYYDGNFIATMFTIPSGVYEWRLNVYTGGVLDHSYVQDMGLLIGDTNGDLVVNMQDIYTNGILNFLVENIDYGYYYGTKPAWHADLNNDYIVNMLDIYWMILQFMEEIDP